MARALHEGHVRRAFDDSLRCTSTTICCCAPLSLLSPTSAFFTSCNVRVCVCTCVRTSPSTTERLCDSVTLAAQRTAVLMSAPLDSGRSRPHVALSTTRLTALAAPFTPAPSSTTTTTATTVVSRIPCNDALLAMPDAQLCSLFHVSLSAVWQWRRTFTQCAPAPCPVFATATRAADLLAQRSKDGQTPTCKATSASAPSSASTVLATGWPAFDAALLGGLRRGWVTEVTGPAQSGKTTVVATWCREILRRGCDCVWLQTSLRSDVPPGFATEAELDNNSSSSSSSSSSNGGSSGGSVRGALHVASLTDLDALQDLLQRWMQDTSSLSGVGAVVVDSVSSLLRRSFSHSEHDALQRHDVLAAALHTLKRLAEKAQVAVLLVSQHHAASAQGPSYGTAEGAMTETSGRVLRWDGHTINTNNNNNREDVQRNAHGGPDVGDLGRLFFHNVNVRLRLRTVRLSHDSDREEAQWRLEVLKCPLCAPLAIALQARVEVGAATSSSGALVVSEVSPSIVSSDVDDKMEGLSAEALYGVVDPWDYTGTPAFVYV